MISSTETTLNQFENKLYLLTIRVKSFVNYLLRDCDQATNVEQLLESVNLAYSSVNKACNPENKNEIDNLLIHTHQQLSNAQFWLDNLNCAGELRSERSRLTVEFIRQIKNLENIQ